MFTYRLTLRMHHTDAAGILYFANQFRIAHEAFESALSSHGIELYRIIAAADFALVIVHAEADYKAPLRIGDEIVVEVSADRIGDSSFTIGYRFARPTGETVGTASTVHVAIDKASWTKRGLPGEVRTAITKLKKP